MKYTFVRDESTTHPIGRLCALVGVSRSGYYDWTQRTPSQCAQNNKQLLSKIRALFATHKQRYGSPRIHAALVQQGVAVSKGHVERLMRKHEIVAQRSKRHKRIYRQREQQKPSPNLLARQFHADTPNCKWVSDITFIPTREGHLYLAIVLDIYSRAIVGWSMSHRINGDLVLNALDMAIAHRGSPENVLAIK